MEVGCVLEALHYL